MQAERGFSTIKTMFWLAVIGAIGWVTVAATDVYYIEWKVQEIFDGVARNMADKTIDEIRAKLPDLYRLNDIRTGDLPNEYYDNLLITATGSRVQISSAYHVTVWLMGEPEDISVALGYSDQELTGADKLRAKARLDFDFSPSAVTP